MPWVDENGNGEHDFNEGLLSGELKELLDFVDDWPLGAGEEVDIHDPQLQDKINEYLNNNPFGDADGDGIPNMNDSFPIDDAPGFLAGGDIDFPGGLSEQESREWLEGFLGEAGMNELSVLPGQWDTAFLEAYLPAQDTWDANLDGHVRTAELYSAVHETIQVATDKFYAAHNGNPSMFERTQFELRTMSELNIMSLLLGVRGGVLDPESAFNAISYYTARGDYFRTLELRVDALNGLARTIRVSGSAYLRYFMDADGSRTLGVVFVRGDEDVDIEQEFEEYVKRRSTQTASNGDPVSTANGEFILKEIDFVLPGRGLDFSFIRHYNSQSARWGMLGWKWSVPLLETRMLMNISVDGTVEGSKVFVGWGDGSWGAFEWDTSHEMFIGTGDEFSKIRAYTALPDSVGADCDDSPKYIRGFSLRKPSGLVYHFCPPTYIEGMGAIGVAFLRKVTDPDGNSITFRRDHYGNVQELIDSMGRQVFFDYNLQGLLTKVTDHQGKETEYFYDDDKKELKEVLFSHAGHTDPTSGDRIVTRPSIKYFYQPVDPNNLGHENSRIAHNISEIYHFSPNPTTTIDYYTTTGYELGKVEHVVNGPLSTSYRYENFPNGLSGTDLPGVATSVRHLTVATDFEGHQTKYYHGENGQMIWQARLNGRVSASDVLIPGSGDGSDISEWWTLWEHGPNLQVTSQLQTTDTLHPSGKWSRYFFDTDNSDRFQQNNLIMMRDYPDGSTGSSTGPFTEVSTVYDALTANSMIVLDSNKNETFQFRGHNEDTFVKFKARQDVNDWRIDQEYTEAHWSRGDVNGDGKVGGTHQVVERILPKYETPIAIPHAGDPTDVELRQTWKYSPNGALLEFQNQHGIRKTIEYSGAYPSKEVFDVDGQAIEQHYVFNSYGQLVKKVGPRNLVTTLEYDHQGLVVETRVTPLGLLNHTSCAAPGSREEEKCELDHGLKHLTFRDVSGKVIGTVGPTTEPGLVYDGNVDFGKLDSTVVYDDVGNVTATNSFVHVSSGPSISSENYQFNSYNSLGLLTEATDPYGTVMRFTYESRGLLTSVSRQGASEFQPTIAEKRTYNWHGALETVEMPLLSKPNTTNVTNYNYDEFFRQKEVIDPQGTLYEFNYDDYGMDKDVRVSSAGETLMFEKYERDSWGQIVQTTTENRSIGPDGAISMGVHAPAETVTQVAYTGTPGQVAIEIEDVGGVDRRVSFEYDPMGKLEHVGVGPFPFQYEEFFEFNLSGDLVKKRVVHDPSLALDGSDGSPRESEWNFSYDPFGYQSNTTFPDGTVHFKTHDNRGNVKFELRADGTRSLFRWDNLGRPISRLDAVDNGIRVYSSAYNAKGDIDKFIEANGSVTKFEYNGFGQIESKTIGFGTSDAFSETYHYNEAGKLWKFEDDSGLVREAMYNVVGSLTDTSATDISSARLDVDTHYDRDALGRVNRVQEWVDGTLTSEVNMTSLSDGQLVQRELVDAFGTETTKNTVNGLGSVIHQLYPSGKEVVRSYDALGRPLSISLDGGVSSVVAFSKQYGLDAAREITTSLGIGSELEFDGLGRVVSHAMSSSVGLISGETYQYRSGGSLESLVREPEGLVQDFIYDATDKLKYWSVSDSAGNEQLRKEWAFDNSNNRTSTIEAQNGVTQTDTVVANLFNQLESILPSLGNFTFLSSGETSSVIGSDSTSFTWDALGRIRSMTQNSQGVVISGVWHYSANGALRSQDFGSSGQTIYSEGLSGEYLSIDQGVGEVEYIHEAAGGVPILAEVSGQLQALHVNWRGDLVSTSGSHPASSYMTSPYGQPLDPSSLTETSSQLIPHMYNGQVRDGSSRLIQFGVRAYAPDTGTFLSRDPKGFEGGANLYEYARSNPYKYNDPTGFAPGLQEMLNDLPGFISDFRASGSSGRGTGGVILSEDFVAVNEWIARNHDRVGLSAATDFWNLDAQQQLTISTLMLHDTYDELLRNNLGTQQALNKGIDQLLALRFSLANKLELQAWGNAVVAVGAGAKELGAGVIDGVGAFLDGAATVQGYVGDAVAGASQYLPSPFKYALQASGYLAGKFDSAVKWGLGKAGFSDRWAERTLTAVGLASIIKFGLKPKARSPQTPSPAPPVRPSTDLEFLQRVADKSEAWGVRNGHGAAGTGRGQGQKKHRHAELLLDRWQRMFGGRSNLETEYSQIDGRAASYGARGSTRADVFDHAGGVPYDFKFTSLAPTARSIMNYIANFGRPATIIRPSGY